METSPSSIAPLLLKNFLISIFIAAEQALLYVSRKSKLLELIRASLVSILLFFLNLLPSLFSSPTPPLQESRSYPFKYPTDDNSSVVVRGGNSGVSRALSQLFLLMNAIPVSSRKYEVVRALIEKLIDENLAESSRTLREVNCAVLSSAFSRTLSQLEPAVLEERRSGAGDGMALPGDSGGNRLLKGFSYFGRTAWRYAKLGREINCSGNSAEKLAAELIWLVQKMMASGCVEDAVSKWASASKLARLALSAEPRLQESLVKVSALLIEQAKDIGKEQEEEGENADGHSAHQFIQQTKVKILVCWLPLLCRSNNGTYTPVLSLAERAELEKTLEEIISTFEQDEQELVLALWLHHFTYCPASDWPNLRACYTRWYNASRAQLLSAESAN